MKNKTTKSRQELPEIIPEKDLQSVRVGDDPPYEVTFKDLESAKKFWWETQKKGIPKLEREVKIIRKERDPIHAKVEALESMHPFEELENYTVNARTRVPDLGGLPDRLISASFSLKPYKKLKEKLAELDQQIEDKEARINAIRSFGILSGDVKVKAAPAAKASTMLKGYSRKELEKLRDEGPASLSLVRAARVAGVTRQTIPNWIKDKKVKPVNRADGDTRADTVSLVNYLLGE